MARTPNQIALGSLIVLDQHRPESKPLQPQAGGAGARPPSRPSIIAAAAAAPSPQPNYAKNIKPPNGAMGQVNFRGWIRFMLGSGQLNPFETNVVLSVMRQSYPSAKQRKVLWNALYRIAPWGCGKWGSPT